MHKTYETLTDLVSCCGGKSGKRFQLGTGIVEFEVGLR